MNKTWILYNSDAFYSELWLHCIMLFGFLHQLTGGLILMSVGVVNGCG